MESSPLTPLIVATQTLKRSFDFKTVDFVTDRNNLRKIMRWISGPADQDFRIDVQRVGKTIILQRWEEKSRESARPGYAQGFDAATLKVPVDCPGSTGHHRIVTYVSNLSQKQAYVSHLGVLSIGY